MAVDVRNGFAKPQQQSLNLLGVQTDTNVIQERTKRKRVFQEGALIEPMVDRLQRRSTEDCELFAEIMLNQYGGTNDGTQEDFMKPSNFILIDCRFRGTRSEMLKCLV
jgi:hypothetical protein